MQQPAFKILIIDRMHQSLLPMLEEAGFIADYQPEIPASNVPAALQNANGLIVRSKVFVDDALLVNANNLQFVARAGAGVDNIAEAALAKRNIPLINAPEGNRDAVGEHCIGLLLALFRHIISANTEVKRKIWNREDNRGEELGSKTVGIIGYGNMGQAFARKLAGFGCQVLAYDKSKTRKPDQFAINCSLNDIFEKADVVSLHIPLTAQNRNFADEAFLRSFRKNIWLLNTARGEVLDQQALVALLQEGKIKGAALDVLENEKLNSLTPLQQQSFEYLASATNVILSPHIAGWTHTSYEKINQILVQKIKALLPA